MIIRFFKNLFKESYRRNRRIEIMYLCHSYDIKDYTINPDLSVDVNGSVYFPHGSFNDTGKLPFQFNIVTGNFHVENCGLKTLEGSPRHCQYFNCSKNMLTTLVGGPDYVIEYNCSSNNLTTFKGICNANVIYCSKNNIYSFEYYPVCKRIILDYNPLHKLWSITKANLDKVELFQDYDAVRENTVSRPGVYRNNSIPLLYIDRFIAFIFDIYFDNERKESMTPEQIDKALLLYKNKTINDLCNIYEIVY